jgi:hypothetical protein
MVNTAYVVRHLYNRQQKPGARTPSNRRQKEEPVRDETALALALTSGKALARTQSAETMSKVLAERLVAQLKASGFVVMRRPIEGGHSPRNAPASWPHTKPDDLR